MNAKLRMLIWSEWRQRRGQLLVCLAWVVLVTLYDIVYEFTHTFRTPVASFQGSASLFAMFAPVFLAMRTSLGEITNHTKSFNEGLPVTARARGWVRLAGGAGVLLLPLVIAALAFTACLAFGWMEQVPQRPLDDWPKFVGVEKRPSLSAVSAVAMVWLVFVVTACSACSLYVLLSWIGTAFRTETHAGFTGAIVAILWFLGGALRPVVEVAGLAKLAIWIGAIVPQSMIINFGYGGETGSYGDLSISSSVLGPLLVNLLLQCGVAALFVGRYSRRLSPSVGDSVARKSRRVWWQSSFPLPTRTVALIWLTLRQSIPMCLPGLILACLMAPLQWDAVIFDPDLSLVRRVTDVLPSSMWAIGTLWAVVVGSGLFAAEMDPRIGEFWRTWPASPWRLFVVKFVIGLAATLLVLDGITIAATWTSPIWGTYDGMNWPYIACMVPLHATMFAVAVAWACVLRRSVVGGIAAIATFAIVMAALQWSSVTRNLDPIDVYNRLNNRGPIETHGPLDFTAHGYPIVATAMALIVLACFVIAAQSLSRYRPRLLES